MSSAQHLDRCLPRPLLLFEFDQELLEQLAVIAQVQSADGRRPLLL